MCLFVYIQVFVLYFWIYYSIGLCTSCCKCESTASRMLNHIIWVIWFIVNNSFATVHRTVLKLLLCYMSLAGVWKSAHHGLWSVDMLDVHAVCCPLLHCFFYLNSSFLIFRFVSARVLKSVRCQTETYNTVSWDYLADLWL